MKYLILVAVLFCLFTPISAESQSDTKTGAKSSEDKSVLVEAILCEDIQANAPQNPATVFSIERRKAFCFTSFDPVPKKIVIYHRWFHRDRPSAKIKLTLKPPRWSTYSSIQLRAEDIGPWRVEIADAKGHIYGILRFSITD